LTGNRFSYALERPAREATLTVTNKSTQVKAIPAGEGEKLAREWDFPRSIQEHELWGNWFTYKDRIVWWVCRVMTPSGFPVFEIHTAIHPRWRRRVPITKLLNFTADFLADKCKGPGVFVIQPPSEAIRPYLGRLGFTFSESDQIWFRRFGDNDG